MNNSGEILNTEGQRLVIETMATLVNIKSTMVELILKPAGVPERAYKDLLYKKDESSGYNLSKRKIAPLLLERVCRLPNGEELIRAIIKIAANWSSFHLAQDEFAARATVQKAREFIGTLELMEAREAKQRELSIQQEVKRLQREANHRIERESELLLMMFDELVQSEAPHQRGYLLQDLLDRLFSAYEIPVSQSFTRNDGAEQIDGAFKLDGWYYIVECRWRKKLADIRELDGLSGQVNRSGKQAMGLFLSINGWSENVPVLLKQNSEKAILLMDGYDLRCVLDRQFSVDLQDFIRAKIDKLNLRTEPFYSISEYSNEQG